VYEGDTFRKSMNYYSFREKEAKNIVIDFVGKSRRRNICARIFKLLRSPGIDSKESVPPTYVAWLASTTPYSCSVPRPHRLLYKIAALESFL
jgi:hypothetical protein